MMQDNGNIVVYVDNSGKPQVDVRFQDETVWLTQAQLVDLYQSSKANVSEHIKNIFDEGELDQVATVRKFRTVRTEGDRQVERELEYYNLDMIISLGYRIKSNIATKFCIWATDRLREYITKGFAIDSERLKNLGGGNNLKGKQTTQSEVIVVKKDFSQKRVKNTSECYLRELKVFRKI